MRITIEVDEASVERAKARAAAATRSTMKWIAIVAFVAAIVGSGLALEAAKERRAKARAAEAQAKVIRDERAAGRVPGDDLAAVMAVAPPAPAAPTPPQPAKEAP